MLNLSVQTSQREKNSDVVVGGGSSNSGGGGGGGSIVGGGVGGGGVGGGSGGVIAASSASAGVMASSLTPSLTPVGHSAHMGEEHSDLEELEQFARTFKQRRIKLGFTQVTRRGKKRARQRSVPTLMLDLRVSHRETLGWLWGNFTVTISAKPPSPGSKPST